MNNNIKLVVVNKAAYATSREVAERFNKKHAEVLYAIEGRVDSDGTVKNNGLLMSGISQLSNLFIKVDYLDSMNRKQYEYLMNRDGFSLLAMGFTGAKAIQYKLDYINKFNEMEQQLKEIETVINNKGVLTEEEYYNIKFSTAQRVRNTFSNSEDIFKDYKRFTTYSRKALDVAKRVTRLNQIINALDCREDNLYKSKQRGYKAERENIIELKEEILRDINEINNRSYGQKLGHATRKTS